MAATGLHFTLEGREQRRDLVALWLVRLAGDAVVPLAAIGRYRLWRAP